MVCKHKHGANIPKNKCVMGLLSSPRGQGVREFEPKCVDPVSDENLSLIFYYAVNLLKIVK